jgi:hypothetical protein
MLQDIDVIDFVAFFAMGPAVRRIGSGAGATMSWKAYMKLSRTAAGFDRYVGPPERQWIMMAL